MYQYPEEWKKYKSAKEYQALVTRLLQEIFPEQVVKSEWDAASHDIHFKPHKQMYFPRIDVAVGPFNGAVELDIGIDKTAVMKSHPLYKKLTERDGMGWNHFSRCFLAVEIIFSGSSKHILGDLANASWNGSIGFVVARSGEACRKASRMTHYFNSKSDAEEAPLRNVKIFKEDDFLQFLWELQNPDKVWRLLVDRKYAVSFGGFFGGTRFPISPYTDRMSVDDNLSKENRVRFSMYGLDVEKIIEAQVVGLSARKYIVPTTSAFIYKADMKNGDSIKIMEIMDMAAQKEFRGKGIESQLLDIFEKIAQKNDCRHILIQLPKDRRSEPLEAQKELFRNHGFEVWYDKRSEFSGWSAKKSL